MAQLRIYNDIDCQDNKFGINGSVAIVSAFKTSTRLRNPSRKMMIPSTCVSSATVAR